LFIFLRARVASCLATIFRNDILLKFD